MNDAATPPDAARMERFASLLATCQRRVFLYAMGLLHNPADAEEVLQETNLVLWRKFDEFREGSDFGQWACRIAYYEVLKVRDKKAHQEKLFSGEFIEVLAAESASSMERADARREALAGCLQKLREQDRQLLMRRYQPQATTRNVAELLGRSVQGTRKSLHRIRMALLACVQRSVATGERA